ncbi:MAG: PDZ domain-containing protein [Kiloniellales bacterium]
MKRIIAFVLFVVVCAVSLPPGEARGMGWVSADLRAEAFARIAVEQAEAGDTAGAMESIALALEAAREIGESSKALSHVAWAQAKVGDLKGALETAQRLSTGKDREYGVVALARIALDLDTQGRKTQAGHVLGRMQDALEDISGEKNYDFEGHVVAAWLYAELGDVRGGLEVAESIAETDVRAAALMAVAEVHARAGDRDAVRRMLSQARAEVTPASREAEPEFVILTALILAEAGDLHGAVDMANGLASLEYRAFALAGVAAFAAGAGDAAKTVAEQALALWDRRASMGIESTSGMGGVSVSALEPGGAAARAGLKAGDTILRFNGVEVSSPRRFTNLLDETTAGMTVPVDFRRGGEQHTANVTLDRRSDDPNRFDENTVLLKTLAAVALAGAGDSGAALAMAEALPSAKHRAPVLAALAIYLSVAGDAEAARATARRVMAEAQNVSEPEFRRMTIGSAAAALAEVGDLAGARAALRLAGDDYEGSMILPIMASARLLAGDARGAADTLMSMSSWWCVIFCSEGPRELIEMAVLQARAGLPADALATAKRIANGRDRTGSLSEIAMVLARAGDLEGAGAVMGEITDFKVRKSAWANIGAIVSGREAKDRPEPARYPSAAQAQALANPYERSVSLAKAAAGLAAAGDTAGALSAVDTARGLATALRDPSLRAWALGAVARAEQALDEPQAARDTLAAALESASAESAPLYRAMILIDLAESASAQGDLVRVRAIAADARQAALQLPLPPKNQTKAPGLLRPLLGLGARAGQVGE